ncbi:MAG: FKBP-type peptidyl-prolyl cis-trans isomerase [Opitutaceae bacterium]|nr:FKBP-type peptidyl-prolyl cis-trans isomerase [Opitutaceae bacterium]
MRESWIVLLTLGFGLAFIAAQARTGTFGRVVHPGEPTAVFASGTTGARELSAEDAALIRERYDNATVTPSGLRYIVRASGSGPTPPFGAEITVHYEGRLLANGKKFDSSHDRGEPYQFRLGLGQVIKGWDEAFATMKRGERRTLIVPCWLAYGTRRRGAIPPSATLVFEVVLLDFK